MTITFEQTKPTIDKKYKRAAIRYADRNGLLWTTRRFSPVLLCRTKVAQYWPYNSKAHRLFEDADHFVDSSTGIACQIVCHLPRLSYSPDYYYYLCSIGRLKWQKVESWKGSEFIGIAFYPRPKRRERQAV